MASSWGLSWGTSWGESWGVGVASPSATVSGTIVLGASEAQIVSGGLTIIVTIEGDTLVAAGATFDAERQAAIDGLDAATSPATGFNNEVRDNLAVGTVVRTSDTVYTITLSAQAAYAIDGAETVTVTVPASILVGGEAIVAAPAFTISALGVGGGGFNILFRRRRNR